MKKLTKEQIDFLRHHDIPPTHLFNADGLKKHEYREIMKDLNKFIAYNTVPCRAAGHTLRTRSGHCCQCKTAVLEYQRRFHSKGITYIAGSLMGKVIKIGFTKSVEIRSRSLKRGLYGGYYDWAILYAIKSENAGTIESRTNTMLNRYGTTLKYNHDGHIQNTDEVYKCSFNVALKSLKKVVESNKYKVEVITNRSESKYNFK